MSSDPASQKHVILQSTLLIGRAGSHEWSPRFSFSRTLSSEDGQATVNLPQSSASSTGHHGYDSIGREWTLQRGNNSSNAMSNSISSLTSNAFCGGNAPVGSRAGYDAASRLRHTFNNARSSSPLSRPPLFSPSLLHEVERSSQQVQSPSGSHPASSPPPRSNVTSPRYFTEPHYSSNLPPHSQPSMQQHSHHIISNNTRISNSIPSSSSTSKTHQHPSQQHSINLPNQHPSFFHLSSSMAKRSITLQTRNGAMGRSTTTVSAAFCAQPNRRLTRPCPSAFLDGAPRNIGPVTSRAPWEASTRSPSSASLSVI